MALDSKYIEVSGLPSFEEQHIRFPSGTFGIVLDAHLASLTANFGFNRTPHRFSLEYIPNTFDYDTLPEIDRTVEFTLGDDFYIKGKIKHASYDKTIGGKTFNVEIEDVREDLNDIFLDTYGTFGDSDAPSTNTVDVRYWYLKYTDYGDLEARRRVMAELAMIDEHGATYRQIYNAIQYFEETEGTINGILAKIPAPTIIEAQLPEEASAYRWHFRMQPLLECLAKILDDVAYDFYWDMNDDRISVINQRFAVNIDQNNIPVAGDTNATINVRYGHDKAENATSVRLYGAQMEGILGLSTFPSSHSLGISDNSAVVLVPGWHNQKIKYINQEGELDTYYPSSRELAMSLLGIEQWAKHRGFGNRISDTTISTYDEERRPIYSTILQRTFSDFNVASMPNRRKEEPWVIELYNRVRQFAQNHYGRTYILSSTSTLFPYLDEIDVVGSAWCNLENQIDGEEFFEGYQIAPRYNKYAPFWDGDNNKLKAFAVFPERTKWGMDGEGTPIGDLFQWTEDDEGNQYVPIEVWQWSYNTNRFQDDQGITFQMEKGLAIRLPSIAWKVNARNVRNEELLSFGGALTQTILRYNDSFATYDALDPYVLPDPPDTVTAYIPIKSRRRYGYAWPSIWSSGAGTHTNVIVEESLAPWNYEPKGKRTSYNRMDLDAKAILFSSIIDRDTVTYAECAKVGLPIISFDAFANQEIEENGYGIVSHGITSLTITHNLEGWWQTKYNIKSHFPQIVKARPIREGADEDFEWAFHRLKKEMDDNWSRFDDNLRDYKVPTFNDMEVQERRHTFKGDTGSEHTFEKYVTISAVYNRGANEYYAGSDSNYIIWPRALASAWGDNPMRQAHCNDGYLQIGMPATYHYEKKADGSVSHYFMGGVKLGAGRIVELTEVPHQINGVWVASCRTLATSVVSPITGETVTVNPFDFIHTPFLAQQGVDTSLAVGDKQFLGSHGNRDLIPDGHYGPGEADEAYAPYLVNTSAPASVYIGYVTTRPSVSTGRGGAVQTYDVGGGTLYEDGEEIDSAAYYIYFVGCEYDQVEINDSVFMIRYRDGDGYRFYAYVNKPLFSGQDSYGG